MTSPIGVAGGLQVAHTFLLWFALTTNPRGGDGPVFMTVIIYTYSTTHMHIHASTCTLAAHLAISHIYESTYTCVCMHMNTVHVHTVGGSEDWNYSVPCSSVITEVEYEEVGLVAE